MSTGDFICSFCKKALLVHRKLLHGRHVQHLLGDTALLRLLQVIQEANYGDRCQKERSEGGANRNPHNRVRLGAAGVLYRKKYAQRFLFHDLFSFHSLRSVSTRGEEDHTGVEPYLTLGAFIVLIESHVRELTGQISRLNDLNSLAVYRLARDDDLEAA